MAHEYDQLCDRCGVTICGSHELFPICEQCGTDDKAEDRAYEEWSNQRE